MAPSPSLHHKNINNMSFKQFYKAPSCAFEHLGIDGLLCESEFAGSVTEDLIVSEDFQW